MFQTFLGCIFFTTFAQLYMITTQMRHYIVAFLAAILLCSCGEYQRAQKSTDINYKFDYAKRAFEEKKYVQAATLLEDCIAYFKGSAKAEE